MTPIVNGEGGILVETIRHCKGMDDTDGLRESEYSPRISPINCWISQEKQNISYIKNIYSKN
tara:strand:+ start:31 stop:216 length:186 start_codon:yes stop_codon:yes gene_type:complete